MRTILVAALDRLVRDEPGIAAAAAVVAAVLPARDVRGVLIRHADRPAIERRAAVGREMEDELVAVVHEPGAVDWLVVADGDIASSLPPRRRDRLSIAIDLIQWMVFCSCRCAPGRLRDVHRGPGIGRLGADVQEQRASRARALGDARCDPHARPLQVSVAWDRVLIGAIADAEVVGGRGDDDRNVSGTGARRRRRGSRRDRTGACCAGVEGCVCGCRKRCGLPGRHRASV